MSSSETTETNTPMDNTARLQELDDAVTRFEGMKRWQDVIKALHQRVELLAEPAERVATLERVASIYLERFSNQAEATKVYEAILDLDPRQARAQDFVKSAYEKRRDFDKLLALQRREAQSAPSEVQLDLYLSMARFVTEKVKKPELCIEMWEQVRRRDRAHPDALTQLGGLYERARDFEKLAVVLRDQAAQTVDPAARAALLVKLGLIASDKLNNNALAVEAWRGVLALEPGQARAQEALKKRYLAMHAWDDLDAFYAESGKWDELIKVLEREADIPTATPESKVALYGKIARLWAERKEKTDRAARYLEKVLEIEAHNRDAALRLAPIYAAANLHKQLAAVLEIKLSADPTSQERVGTLRALGELYENPLRDPARALERYRDAFLNDPSAERSLQDLERVAGAADAWTEVQSALSLALGSKDLDPSTSVPLRLRLAEVLHGRLGQVDQAIQSYNEVLAVDANNTQSLGALEGLLRDTRRWGDLLSVLQQRLSLAQTPDDRRALLYALASLSENELNDPSAAIDACGAITAEFGDESAALAALDRLFTRTSRWDDLSSVLERELVAFALEDNEAGLLDARLRLGNTLESHLGRGAEALGHYREILGLASGHADARRALERMLQDSTLRAEAARVLEPIYEAQRDWEALIRAVEILLTEETDTAARVALLARVGSTADEHLNDPRRAFDAYGRAFREDPGSPELRAKLSGLAARLNAHAELVALLRAAAEACHDDTRSRALWIALGDAEYHTLGALDRAVKAYEKVLSRDAADPEALAALDRTYRAAGRWNELLAVHRRRLEFTPEGDARDVILMDIASVHEELLGDPDAAVQSYRDMLARDPANARALSALDRLFTRLGRWSALADNLQHQLSLATELAPWTAVQFRLAELRRTQMGETDNAIELYRQILERDGANPQALGALEALVEEPQHATFVASILEPAYRELGAFDRLARVFEVLSRFAEGPGHRVELLHRKADIEESALDDPTAAFETLARALAEDPSNEETLGSLDRLSRMLGNHAELAATLEGRIHTDPAPSPELRVNLHQRAAAVCEERLEDFERAIGHHVAILALAPSDLAAASALERLYQLTDKLSELAQVFLLKASLVEGVDEQKSYLLRASELFETALDQPQGAIDAYRRITEIDDADLPALDALIRLYLAPQRWEELLATYEAKARLVDDPEEKKRIYFQIASVFESELSDPARAVDAYNRVLELDPQDLVAIQRLDHIYSSQGNWRELLSVLEREADLSGDPNEVCAHRFRIGQLHQDQLGDTLRAVEIYRDILDTLPEHEPSLAALTSILRGDKDPLAAAAVLEPVLSASGAFDRVAEVLEVQLSHASEVGQRVELLHRIAETHETLLENPEAALEALSRAVAHDPLNDHTLSHLERLADASGQWPLVAARYDAAAAGLQGDPERHVELLLRVAQVYEVQVGDVPAAIARYQLGLGVEPENLVALRSLDRLFEATERWTELAEVLRREAAAAELSPEEAMDSRSRLALTLEQKLGDLPAALAVYRENLEAEADHAPSVTALEALFARNVERPAVAALLEPIYELGAEWEKLTAMRAACLEFVTDPAERLSVMHRVAELSEERLGDPATALEWHARALRESPLEGFSLKESERLAAMTSGWAELTNVYADIVEAEGQSPEVRQALGKRLARIHEEELNDLVAAEGAYTFVLEVAPLDPEALEALDRLYSAAAEWQRLAEVLDRRAQAATDDPQKIEFTFRLAEILQRELQQTETAIQRYKSIVEALDPHHEQSLNALEALYIQTERWPELYAVYEGKLAVVQGEAEQAEIYSRMAKLADQYLGLPDKSVELLGKVLELLGDDSDALSALADLHESAGRFTELIDVLERQLSSESDMDRRAAIALRVPGVYLHKIRDTERAIEGYKRVLDIDPASFEALRALAEIYRAGSQWDELVATLQTMITLGSAALEAPELKAIWSELARIFWDTLHQAWEATDAWNHVLETDPKDTEALESLLVIHSAEGQWRDVVEVLNRKVEAIETPEVRIPVLLQLAETWEARVEEPDGARAAYDKIIEIDPLHDRAFAALELLHRDHSRWEELTELYVARHDKLAEEGEMALAVPLMRAAAVIYDEELGDREQAYDAAQIAFEEDVTDGDSVAVLEKLAGATNKWNELLKSTQEAYQTETSARKTPLGLHLARWYGIEHNRPEWAIPIYNQILATEPDNLQALRAMAALYRKTAQWPQLARILQSCVKVARTPSDRKACHIELGEVLEKNLKQVEQAIASYTAALELDPRESLALDALARVHAERGDWGLLVDVLRRTVDATEDVQEAIEHRLRVGEILEDRLADLDTAIVEYRGVLAVDEGNLAALRGLERLYARLNLPSELLAVLEVELGVVPTERERIKLLTRIAEMLEEEFVRIDAAIERYEQVVEIEPTNDGALRGLERLYRQTARWQDLIATLDRHLVASGDRRDRVPIFEQMGRVYADELKDFDHAEDAFANVLQIDHQHLASLEALARVYEAKADWHRAVEIMEQLSMLMVSDTERTVDLRYRIARIAEESLQDEAHAAEQYQMALDLNPDHLPSLAALRAIATRREDWHDVARFLDREQAITEQPRARARLLTELGRVTASYLDEHERSVACYEEAVRSDPDNEDAAMPLCGVYVSQERWAEAEPLAEMLTRKAARRDPAEQLQIQLTMGKVAQSLEKLDRAVKAFNAAISLDRSNIEAIRAVSNAHFLKRDWESAFKSYQLLLVHHKEQLDEYGRADLYHRLGVIKREQGDRRRAVNFLDKSVEEVPGYRPALEAMIETYGANNEWEKVLECKTLILEQVDDPQTRYAMLLENGELWHKKASNVQKAIASLAQALEYKPDERTLLHKLMALYQESQQWSKVIDTIARISALTEDPTGKSRYAYTIAIIYDERIKNAEEALNFYNQALDLNPSDLKPFAKINEILTTRRDFKQLERNFRKMLHRVTNKGEKDLEFNLLHNLGVIYRDRLGQTDAAIKAFQMASDRQPDNLTEHKILAELYTNAGSTPEAVTRWYTILQSDLGNEAAIDALYNLYYKSRQYDKAWCVASTACFLLRDRASAPAREFYEQYKPKRPLTPQGRLSDEHWMKLLFHANEDHVVSKIFASILVALRAAKVNPIARLGFTDKERQDPASSTIALVKQLAQAAAALNVSMPLIFLRPQQAGGLAYLASDPIASFAGGGLLQGLTPQELAFVAAKHMTYYRNEHYIRTLFPALQEISVILVAAIKMVKTDQDVSPEALATAQELQKHLAKNPIAVEELRKMVRIFLDQGGASNIKKWYQAVELTASRAGFLLSGDLDVAKKMLNLDPALPSDVPPTEKLKDVTLFSMSENYFALREALGINFQSAAGY